MSEGAGAPVTSITQRIPLDEITVQARQVRFSRVLLTVLAALFFGIGWLAGRLFLGVAWCAVAVRTGWQEGRYGGPAGTG
jgi:hypothetical protein